jgi:hypothetical protein
MGSFVFSNVLPSWWFSLLFPSVRSWSLFSLTLVLFALLIFSHSLFQHLLITPTFGIIMDGQKLGQLPSSFPYRARPQSLWRMPRFRPQQRLHLLPHLPTWITVYIRSYSTVHIAVDAVSCHTFRYLFIVSSNYRLPTYRSRVLPLWTMSSSSNSNKVALRRCFLSTSPINGVRRCRACPRQACSVSSTSTPSLRVSSPFCFVEGDDQGNDASTNSFNSHYRVDWPSSYGDEMKREWKWPTGHWECFLTAQLHWGLILGPQELDLLYP